MAGAARRPERPVSSDQHAAAARQQPVSDAEPSSSPAPPPSPKKQPRYFYGWNVVGAAFLAHLAYAEHHSSVLGFFFHPLEGEFGWSRSAIAAVQSIARIVEAVLAPFVGPFIDRYGPRALMPIGALIVGLAMIGATQVQTIWQFYLLRGVIVAVGFVQSWIVALTILNLCLISAVMALGVNMQWGYAGLFNAGVMGFAALGGIGVVLTAMPPVPGALSAGGVNLGLAAHVAHAEAGR